MAGNLETRIYRQFDTTPLRADQTDLYVDLDSVRGSSGIVHRIMERIQMAGRDTAQVLAGHNGSGKSTELYLLQQALETGTPKYFVVFCRSDDDLDRNDIDFPEILIAVVRQLAKQLREREHIELKPGYFKDRWERLAALMKVKVEFQDAKLEVGMLKLGAAIKNSPDARLEVRKLLEPDAGNWLDAANDVISEAMLELQKKGYAGLVILVDDLDKMIVRPHADAGCNTAEYLFIHRSAQLTAFKCHMVYKMPLSLAYSHHEATIKKLYGGHVPVVPMIKIATPPPANRPHEKGIDKMEEMVLSRLKVARATTEEVFQKPAILRELIKLSGGQPTELMTLLRESIISGGLPLNRESLKRATREGQREYARQLRREHWPIIEEVRQTGQAIRDNDNEAAIRELLDSRAIVQYVNDIEWYGLNPMVASLKPPSPLPTATPVPPAAGQP